MKVREVQSQHVLETGRLDCWYHLSPGNTAIEILNRAKAQGVIMQKLGGTGGLAKIWKPNRSRMNLSAPNEPAIPYLRPYDLFNYLPEASDWLSSTRTRHLKAYSLTPGMILQTCSGRNLGPSAIVDGYLAQFIVGADMIRIEIQDREIRHYVLAFLNSWFGRSLMRRQKTGSVIDHLDPRDLQALDIPFIDKNEVRAISRTVGQAIHLREDARLTLHGLVESYEKSLPPVRRRRRLCTGWTVKTRSLTGRLDAAFYDPLVTLIRNHLIELGGCRVNKIANVFKPAGRYKTRYVEESNGLPLLSGAQLLQTRPINLQFMSSHVFKDVADYELRSGWIAYPADGRAEEELGTPVLVTKDRDGWLASGHIGRIVPMKGTDVGWLFLALKTIHAQVQLKARASGSVVDSTFPTDMEDVILPPKLSEDGSKIRQLWKNFSKAQELEEKASKMLDDSLLRCGQ